MTAPNDRPRFDRRVVYFDQGRTRHVVDVQASEMAETVRVIRANGGEVVSVGIRPEDRQPPSERTVTR